MSIIKCVFALILGLLIAFGLLLPNIASAQKPIKAAKTVSHAAQAAGGSAQNPKPNPILDFLENIASRIITLNNPVQFKNPKREFQMSEVPNFTLSIPKKVKDKIGNKTTDTWQTKDEIIQATLVYKKDGSKVPITIRKNKEGVFELQTKYEPGMQRGEYHLTVAAKESFLYTRNLSQDFTWGVLAINTNKSMYTPGETAQLAMGVVNDRGDTVCNAKLTLTIADPDKQETRFSTDNKTIGTSPDCGSYKPTPDYSASYKTQKTGRYFMRIVAQTTSGTHEITDYFEVKKDLPFEVERLNFPTRVYPTAAYPVEIKVKANQDYQGTVTEYIPNAIQVTNISNGGALAEKVDIPIKNPSLEVLRQDKAAYGHIPTRSTLLYADKSAKAFTNQKTVPLTWNVNWKKGQTYTLSYALNFAPIAPEFYLAGPIQIGRFQEARPWQFAIDASKCWAGTVNANWSTANNWVTTAGAAATLGSADVAVFDSSTTTCTSGGTNNNSTLDAAFGGSVQAVSILTYTGTITQNLSLTITTGGVNVGFSQTAAGSTWTGNGAYNITMNTVTTSDFNQTAGTFTAPTGTITVAENFTSSAGTFNHNNGTILLDFANGTTTWTGSVSVYNLTVGNGDCNPTFSVAAGTTITAVNGGTLKFDSDPTCNPIFYSTTGTIAAQGNITLVGTGVYSNVAIRTMTVSGTGNQTITGETDNNTRIIALNFTKTGGTVTISNTIVACNGWTNSTSNTTFTVTGSGVVFEFCTGDNFSITGSTTFNNMRFQGCTSSGIASIPSGTTITVNGTLTFAGDPTCSMLVNGPGTLDLKGNLTTEAGTYGVDVLSNAPITFSGSANQTITHSGSNFPGGSLTVNKSAGSVSLATTLALQSGQSLSISSGTFDLAGFNLTGSPAITTSGTGTFKLQGAETVTATKNFTGGTVQFSGTNNNTANTYTVTTLSTSYYNLTINNAETTGNYDIFSLGATTDINGAFTLTKGNFQPGANTMTIAGNFRNGNGTGATFTTGTSTVNFDSGGTSTVYGVTTFNNLTSTTAGKELDFEAGGISTVSGALTLTGSVYSPITIRSTTSGTYANLNNSGTNNVRYVDVKDNDASYGGGGTITANNSSNSGHNVNWTFAGSFTTDTSGATWYNQLWLYRRKISIDHTKVSSTQTNFPVLINTTLPAAKVQASGNDILFTAADGTTKLSHEIESYNSTTGALIAWVKVPTLSSTQDTLLHIYYGNSAAANQQSATSVWDANYKAVQHLKETGACPLTFTDSTSTGVNGSCIGTPTATTGQIGGGWATSATDNVIDLGNNANLFFSGSFTISAWIKATGGDATTRYFIGDYNSAGNQSSYALRVNTSNLVDFFWENPSGTFELTTSTTTISLNTWYYVTASWDGTTRRIYINGSQEGTNATAQSRTDIGGNTTLGRAGSLTGIEFPGALDEVRFSNSTRSAGWILTEYNNQSSPSTFAPVGLEQTIYSTRIQGGVKFQGGTKIQ